MPSKILSKKTSEKDRRPVSAAFGKPYLLLFMAGAALFILFYDQIENFFVFHPQAHFDVTPKRMGLSHESITFEAADGTKLHGWFFPLPGTPPVILFCHGNGGNISHRLDNIEKLLKNGFEVFIFDYRGYGKSGGTPSRKGIYRDGVAAYDYLVKKRGISPDRIVLFGRSLGGAVAMEIGVSKRANRLILESAFTSTRDLARTMPLFFLLSPFLPAHFNNLKKVKNLNMPILIIHGDRDQIIPFDMGKELFEAAAAPKAFYAIEGAGHNDTWVIGGRRYFETLKRFMES